MKQIRTKSFMFSAGIFSLVCVSVYGFAEPTATAPGGNVAGPVTVGSSDQTKEGALTVNTNGTASEGLIVDEGNLLVRDGEASFSNGSYSDPHNGSTYDAKFGGASRGIAVRGTSYFADKIGLGDSSPDASLLLDIEGQIGASEYCDEDGANCIDIASVGGGSIDGLSDGVSDDSSVFLGLNSGDNDNRTSNYNAGLGINALAGNVGGYGNTAVGESALRSNTSGYLNTAIGVDALYSSTNGRYNIAIGESSLRGHDGGENNIGIGTRTLYGNNNGQLNIGIGYESLYGLTTGTNNIAMGYYSLYNNTVGDFNAAIGDRSMYSNTTGYDNVAFGSDSLYDNTTGYSNVAIGPDALSGNSTGRFNIGIGSGSLEYGGSADSNVAIGTWSQGQNTGTHNTSLGHASLYAATNATENIAIGSSALFQNRTGNNNIAIGMESLYDNRSGSGNVVIGDYAAQQATNVTSNVIIGSRAGHSHDGSTKNVAIGFEAMYGDDVDGERNIAIGDSTLYALSSGQNNIAIGTDAMNAATVGNRNVALGFEAGQGITTGEYNIAVGDQADVASATGDRQLSIGNLIYGTGLNGGGATISTGNIGIGETNPSEKLEVNGNIRVAGTSTTCILGNGSGNTACTSDERLKDNVAPLGDALERVQQLNGVSYTWKDRAQDGQMIGVIAQNVEEVFPEIVHEDKKTGYKSVEYATLVAPLIESVKELADRVEILEMENQAQKELIHTLQK